MKKLFKLFALALLAGSMMTFVACGGDDPNTPDNPNTPDTPDTPNTPGAAGYVKLVFAAENIDYTAPQDSVVAVSQNGTAIIYSCPRACSLNGTQVSGYFPMTLISMPTTAGTYDTTAATTQLYTGNFNQYGYSYSDWACETLSIKVTGFDAATATISANVTSTMVDQFTYATTENMELADAPRADLTATVSSLKLKAMKGGNLTINAK